MKYQDLITALEGAEEPSRELDARIWCLPSIYEGMSPDEDGRQVVFYDGDNGCYLDNIPHLTSDIAQTLKFVRKGCHARAITMRSQGTHAEQISLVEDPLCCSASIVFFRKGLSGENVSGAGLHHDFPMALCIAYLRLLEAEEKANA